MAEFIQQTTAFRKENSIEKMKQHTTSILSTLFDIVDTNADGEISHKEFAVFFKCMRIPEEYAKPSFNAIDTDKNGIISREEFIAAGNEFYHGVDSTHPSATFFGPLLD